MPSFPTPSRRLVLVVALVLSAAALAAFVARRDPGPTADFHVTIDDPATARIDVELRLGGVDPHRTLALTGFGASPELERVDFAATRADGSVLETRTPDTGSDDPLARVEIEAPRTSVVHVRYALVPRAHLSTMAPRDRPLPLDARFGLASGRDLFMLPMPARAVSGIDVQFSLPDGWLAYAPWLGPREHRGHPAHGAEELIASAIGFGRFEETSFDIEGTRYRVMCEASLPPPARASMLAQMKTVAAYLADWFPHPLGPSYAIVATPAVAGQSEHLAEAWGTGQGGTLWPLTAERLHHFALCLIDAYLVAGPYRLEFQDSREAWVPSALRGMLAVEAVAAARGIPQRDVDRHLAHEYATMPGTVRGELDLERLPAPGARFDDTQTMLAANAAPYVLRCLERHVQNVGVEKAAATPVRERPLRRALHHGARDLRIRSLLGALATAERARLGDFRETYVRGRSTLAIAPDRDSSEVTPTTTTAGLAAAPADQRVRLMLTAQTMGYLENCGCKLNQSGGVARRRALIREQRLRDPGMLLVDVGSSFPDPDRTPPATGFALGEQIVYVRTLELMRYDAFVPGYTEFANGPSHFSRLADSADLPWIGANIPQMGGHSLAPVRVVRRGGRTARIIGAYEPIGALQLPSALEAALDSVRVEDTVASVRREAAKAMDSELVIVVGELSSRTIHSIVHACPQVDVVVSAPDRMRGELAPIPRGGSTGTSGSGFLGQAYVMYADLGEYGVKTLDLELTPDGHVARATENQIDLDGDIREDPEVQAMLDGFYADVSAADLAGAIVEAPFVGDPLRNRGGYVGGAACASCHAAEADQWESTAHAHAYKTLLDAHRHYQPRCVSCHVVGFGTPDGYRMNTPSEHLEDVQCETCHGPGAAHAASPSRTNIVGQVPEAVCLACHTPEHSNAFDYADRIERVRHRGSGPLVAHDSEHGH